MEKGADTPSTLPFTGGSMPYLTEKGLVLVQRVCFSRTVEYNSNAWVTWWLKERAGWKRSDARGMNKNGWRMISKLGTNCTVGTDRHLRLHLRFATLLLSSNRNLTGNWQPNLKPRATSFRCTRTYCTVEGDGYQLRRGAGPDLCVPCCRHCRHGTPRSFLALRLGSGTVQGS